jgi:hypothetical protein
MSKGVVLFALNNERVDYFDLASFCATQITKHLKLPVTVVTDENTYERKKEYFHLFDNVVPIKINYKHVSEKRFQNGFYDSALVNYRNNARYQIYDLTPYDETLVIDVDVIIGNDSWLNVFKSDEVLLISQTSQDINFDRGKEKQFTYISDESIPFYWATVFYFKKCDLTRKYFNLVRFIQENWDYYRRLHMCKSELFRNDYAFSIALNMLSNYGEYKWWGDLPGKIYHSMDTDVLLDFNKDTEECKMLVRHGTKKTHSYQSVKGLNLHIMNKLSLQEQAQKCLKDI